MGIAELIGLALTAIQTIQNVQASGRAKTTAEEDAALAAAWSRAQSAHAGLQAIDPDNPRGVT